MTVTVSDVREFLKDLPSEFVSDAAVQKQIDLAQFIVDHEKSDNATAEEVDKAVLVLASYHTAVAYAAELERSLGVLPPQLESWLRILESMAEKVLQYVKSGGAAQAGKISLSEMVCKLSDTIMDYVRSGNVGLD